MVDLTQFAAGIEAARKELSKYGNDVDAREGFRSELIAAGFTPPSIFDLGKITRIKAPDDTDHKKSGWCILSEIPASDSESKAIGVGVYGNWKGNPDRVVWTSRNTAVMSGLESAQYHAAMEAAKAQRELELKMIQAETAERAFKIWNEAKSVESHDYLSRKKVNAFDGVRTSRGDLVIPVCHDNKVVSLQFIKANGDKKFLGGGRTKGCYFVIQGRVDLIIICEGYATGASLAMASGATVYCSFMAGNLYEVAAYAKSQHLNARLIIAGDDDKQSSGNVGRTKATQAADGLGIESMFPECEGTDFNDQHAELGIDSIKRIFNNSPVLYKKRADSFGEYPPDPIGFMADVVNYYNATSGNKQPLFAIQTALAIASVICGRGFVTNYDNYSALYLLNVGKSATGKEHAKTVIDSIMSAANEYALISGEGHTSAGAVLTALIAKPRHIVVIDEFSKHLQAAKKAGNSHLAEANSALMKAITSCHSTMRGKAYSQLSLAKEKRSNAVEYCMNPSLTMLAMCPPDDLFSTIDIGAVKDGFLNRIIICISDAKRELREYREPIEVPESIKEWITAINNRRGATAESPNERPNTHKLTFEGDAINLHKEFAQWCIDRQNQLEKNSLSELHGRSAEMALRIALIHALSRDVNAETIILADMQWAIEWVKYNVEKVASVLKSSIASSEFEGWKMESLNAIRAAGENGISQSSFHKQKPFSAYREKDRHEIIKALMESELIACETRTTGKRGRPSLVYFAIEGE